MCGLLDAPFDGGYGHRGGIDTTAALAWRELERMLGDLVAVLREPR